MRTFEIAQGGSTVPPGVYKMKFDDVEDTEHDEYGPGLKFIFEVTEGEHCDEQATRITSATPTPANAAGRMINGITGKTLSPKMQVDLTPFIGKVYLVQVEKTKNDSTRVASAMRTDI